MSEGMNKNPIQHYIECFEQLSPETLDELEACFDEGARFVDPFNDVRGRKAIRRVFEHMFSTCEGPRFSVIESLGADSTVYLRWQFSFGPADARQCIEGVSRVQFSSQHLVTEHVDYWDAASQLYESLPWLGWLFRALRKRLSAPERG